MNTLEKAIEKYGADLQKQVAIEEMAKQYANRVGVEVDYWDELEGYS